MKKYLLIIGILCAIVATPACAVNNNPTTSPSSGTNGQLNWATTSGGVSIQGVAFCGSKNGDAVTSSTAGNNNAHCWCKMTNPVDSPWAFFVTPTSADYCVAHCAFICAANTRANAAFRSLLLDGEPD